MAWSITCERQEPGPRDLFAHTAIHRIEAGTQPENEAEQRALRKVGFRQEGVLRGAEFRDGSWRDIVIFGLLRGEQADDWVGVTPHPPCPAAPGSTPFNAS